MGLQQRCHSLIVRACVSCLVRAPVIVGVQSVVSIVENVELVRNYLVTMEDIDGEQLVFSIYPCELSLNA